MTLIEQRRSDGTLKGRCDAKCYRAKGKRCKCLCGGLNHGIGYNKTLISKSKIVKGFLAPLITDGEWKFPILDNEQLFLF